MTVCTRVPAKSKQRVCYGWDVSSTSATVFCCSAGGVQGARAVAQVSVCCLCRHGLYGRSFGRLRWMRWKRGAGTRAGLDPLLEGLSTSLRCQARRMYFLFEGTPLLIHPVGTRMYASITEPTALDQHHGLMNAMVAECGTRSRGSAFETWTVLDIPTAAAADSATRSCSAGAMSIGQQTQK